MRALLLALVLLAVPLAGCADQAPTEPEGPEPPDGDPTEVPGERSGDGMATVQVTGLPRPALEVGQAWTYQATGVYDTQATVTVVVAEASEQGYLLAGVGPEDLLEAIAWGRAWHGPVDAELNPQGDGQAVLFDFPLTDGKTWTSGERTVTVELTDVPHPDGPREGARMTVGSEQGTTTWTYEPTTQYLTSYTSTWGGTTYLELTLTGTSRSPSWTWYEDHGRASTADGPASLAVPDQAEAVIVSAGGWGGGQAQLLPAPTGPPPESYRFLGEEAWTYELLPAIAGDWTLAAETPPDGLGYITAAAVSWIGPGAP